MEPTEHLFRHESGRLVAAMTRVFGIHNLELAQDVVQDAFCRALEVWRFKGVPENPSAWLMATARNRAIDVLRRERLARSFAPDLGKLLESEWTLSPVVDELLAPNAIKDDQLRMMFSCCQPRLSEEAQVALILNVLCGFSAGEIAGAFVCGQAAIEKRITRAKKVLASSSKLFDLVDGAEFAVRLKAVQRGLYLLFNEGYHGASAQAAVRSDLCREAMRLSALLLEHPLAAMPATYAMAALMCFNAARLPTRLDAEGHLQPLSEQNRSRWDRELILEGHRLLNRSAAGDELTEYHLEAAIASIHADAPTMAETDWAAVVSLYDSLLAINPSPVIALNRAIAVAQLECPQRGIEEIEHMGDRERLADYPFYHAALGDLELRCGRHGDARRHLLAAAKLARNPTERQYLEKRAEAAMPQPAPG